LLRSGEVLQVPLGIKESRVENDNIDRMMTLFQYQSAAIGNQSEQPNKCEGAGA
jgi:hypothetical protein